MTYSNSLDTNRSAEEQKAERSKIIVILLAVTQCCFLVASSAPTPVYEVYQARFGVTTTETTVVFAAYALALLGALLTIGGISDFIGRRVVIIVSLCTVIVAMILFCIAKDAIDLVCARVLQGFATGAVTGATSAAIIENLPSSAAPLAAKINSVSPILGLAIGALLAGLLVAFVPWPTVAVFVLLAIVFALLLVATLAFVDNSPKQIGVFRSLRPAPKVPREAVRVFIAVAPSLLALWALAGYYMSLGPKIVSRILYMNAPLAGGGLVFVLMGSAAVGLICVRVQSAKSRLAIGQVFFVVGLTISLISLSTTSIFFFFSGAIIAGFGFGNGFLGGFRLLTSYASTANPAQLISSVYIVCYIGFSVPAILGGIAASEIGLLNASYVYGSVLLLLGGGGLVSLLVPRLWLN